jgi:hypothetical protein
VFDELKASPPPSLTWLAEVDLRLSSESYNFLIQWELFSRLLSRENNYASCMVLLDLVLDFYVMLAEVVPLVS